MIIAKNPNTIENRQVGLALLNQNLKFFKQILKAGFITPLKYLPVSMVID